MNDLDLEPGLERDAQPAERPKPRLSATVRFYLVFAVVLLALVWASYESGYRAGISHGLENAARQTL